MEEPLFQEKVKWYEDSITSIKLDVASLNKSY